MDDAGNITGGMVWTREGQKAAGENDSAYPFGWNSERFAGGAPASGGLPFMLGAYLTALHRGIASPIAGMPVTLPDVALPTAFNQAKFSVRENVLLPASVWQTVAAKNLAKKEGEPERTGGAAAGDCMWCCVLEGNSRLVQDIRRPRCPGDIPAQVVGIELIGTGGISSKKVPERSCVKTCPKFIAGKVVWEASLADPQTNPMDLKHCCNPPGCCNFMAKCGDCYIPGRTCGPEKGKMPDPVKVWEIQKIWECQCAAGSAGGTFYTPARPFVPYPDPSIPRQSTGGDSRSFHLFPTGITHGNYCGVGHGQAGGPEVDALDHCCCLHDKCVGSVGMPAGWFTERCHRDLALCASAVDCSRSHDPKSCEDMKKRIDKIWGHLIPPKPPPPAPHPWPPRPEP
jgi:hypothetical protein